MNELDWCVRYLKEYNGIRGEIDLPIEKAFRALMNITMPVGLSDEFYEKQDAVLKRLNEEKGVVAVNEIEPLKGYVSLYKGDITTLKADCIVNACNEKLLGCFQPLHGCIDNAIHSFAGLQVRRDLMFVMQKQGTDEPNGKAKITSGYNLPSKYILHTVGPKVGYKVSEKDREDLKNCYLSCLRLADENKAESVVFCSLATGIYGYPISEASKIATITTKKYMEEENKNIKKIIFNVFSERDYDVYNGRIKETY